MKLQCENKNCSSHNPCITLFSVRVVVNEKGELDERTTDLQGEAFECVYCQSDAEWVVEDGD
jgi:hypothetical protein